MFIFTQENLLSYVFTLLTEWKTVWADRSIHRVSKSFCRELPWSADSNGNYRGVSRHSDEVNREPVEIVMSSMMVANQ